jgi:hypothetical protein
MPVVDYARPCRSIRNPYREEPGKIPQEAKDCYRSLMVLRRSGSRLDMRKRITDAHEPYHADRDSRPNGIAWKN